jgi:hypothetical protein
VSTKLAWLMQQASFPKFNADTTELILIMIASPFWIALTEESCGVSIVCTTTVANPNALPLFSIVRIKICASNEYENIVNAYFAIYNVSNATAIT